MKIKIIKYYKDIVETEKENKPIYFSVDTIRDVEATRAKELINSGVAEAIKERKTKTEKSLDRNTEN